jgi:flagellar assembly factor FliW
MNTATALVTPDTSERTIESALLGVLAVPEIQMFTFERGLLGFPEAREFALVPARRGGMFWLQSADFEALTFLLVDPFQFVPDYSVELGEPELGSLIPEAQEDLLLLAILTLPRSPDALATANLQGPLALNLRVRQGRQVVIADSPWGVRYEIHLK